MIKTNNVGGRETVPGSLLFVEMARKVQELKESNIHENKCKGFKSWGASEYSQDFLWQLGSVGTLILVEENFRDLNSHNSHKSLGREMVKGLFSLVALSQELGLNLETEFNTAMNEIKRRFEIEGVDDDSEGSFSDLKETALGVRDLYKAKNAENGFNTWGLREYLLGLYGDSSYLNRLVMANDGYFEIEKAEKRLRHKLGDCLWSLFVVASELGVDLESEFRDLYIRGENK